MAGTNANVRSVLVQNAVERGAAVCRSSMESEITELVEEQLERPDSAKSPVQGVGDTNADALVPNAGEDPSSPVIDDEPEEQLERAPEEEAVEAVGGTINNAGARSALLPNADEEPSRPVVVVLQVLLANVDEDEEEEAIRGAVQEKRAWPTDEESSLGSGSLSNPSSRGGAAVAGPRAGEA